MTDAPIPAQRTTLEDAYEQAAEEQDLDVLLAPYRSPSGCLLPGCWIGSTWPVPRDGRR